MAIVLDDEKERRRKLAVSALLECDGNKITAIKRFLERFDVDMDKAREYIDWAEAEILGQSMPSVPDMISSCDEDAELDSADDVEVISAKNTDNDPAYFSDALNLLGQICKWGFRVFRVLWFCFRIFVLLPIQFILLVIGINWLFPEKKHGNDD